MYSQIIQNEKEIKYVIDNLCKDTVIELKKMFGKNYKEIVFEEIKHLTTKYIIKLGQSNEPVGLFGLIPQSKKSAQRSALSENSTFSDVAPAAAGIFLLTTDQLHKGNKILFLRHAKKQIEMWLSEYDLLMDSCYKENLKIQKWLMLLGFKPSIYQDDNFQIYYKGDLNRVSLARLGLVNEDEGAGVRSAYGKAVSLAVSTKTVPNKRTL